MEFDNEKEPTLALIITWPRACQNSSSRINCLLSFGICLAPSHVVCGCRGLVLDRLDALPIVDWRLRRLQIRYMGSAATFRRRWIITQDNHYSLIRHYRGSSIYSTGSSSSYIAT